MKYLSLLLLLTPLTISGCVSAETFAAMANGFTQGYAKGYAAGAPRASSGYVAPPTQYKNKALVWVDTSYVKDEFNGWHGGDTVVELGDGSVWQQNDYSEHYIYAYMPTVKIYKDSGGRIVMSVNGNPPVPVKRIR
jgi:hypothetical protein